MKTTTVFSALGAVFLLTACQPVQAPDDAASSASAVSESAESDVFYKGVGKSPGEDAVVRPFTDAEVTAGAKDFMAAVMSDDLALLRAYYPADYRASELEPDAVDPTFARKTLRPIIAAGPMSAREIWRKGHTFSILFYQTRFKDQADKKAYQEKEYMKSFFVCNFNDAGGRWKVADPVLCYDETEGPYEAEPDA